MYDNPLEAFKIGTEIPLGPKSVTKEEIIEFATEFDPIYFHIDEELAKDSILGGLSASGFHTCSMAMRMMCDAYITQSTSQGAPGIDDCKWLAPVQPGDTLNGVARVIDCRRSKSKNNIMIVKFEYEFWNQHKIPVLFMSNSGMFKIPQEVQA